MTFKPGQSGNVKGRTPKAVAAAQMSQEMQARNDSWMNHVTALGTSRDKRTHSYYAADVVTDIEALSLWRSEDMCRRVIEAEVNEAFRRGVKLNVGDQELGEEIQGELEELKFTETFVRAAHYENAFGGAAIYGVMNDTDAVDQPLNEDGITKLSAFHIFEPRELWPSSWYTDVQSPKFGTPETWRLIPVGAHNMIGAQMLTIHESRLIIFPGKRISRQILPGQRSGWGDSKLSGVYATIRDFGSVWGSAANILEDFAQAVLKMDGYAELMKTTDGEAIVKSRLRMLDMMRSSIRAMIVDKGDDFVRTVTPVSGLAELLQEFAQRIAAAADMPVTVMMGMAPAGLNATGDNDMRSWYDKVGARREHHYKCRYEQGVRWKMLAKDSVTQGKEPKVWDVGFPPLWEPTELETATTRKLIAETDKINIIDCGIYTADDAANSHYRGDTFSADIKIDWKERDAQKKVEEAMAKEAQARELELHNAKVAAVADPNAVVTPAPNDGSAPPPVNVVAAQPTNGIQQRGG